MDISLLIRQRLSELGLDQKDLASAAGVTESYISQLLARKKAPPAPRRTDLYERMGDFLRLPSGELSKLADVQRRQELKKKAAEPPEPLFKECRALILRKCKAESRAEVQRIVEREPFGELERLVTQTILEVAQGVVREEQRRDDRLLAMAENSGRSPERVRSAVLEFLEADVFHVSIEGCLFLLEAAIDCWDINLKTFGMEVVRGGRQRRFEFMEKAQGPDGVAEPGFAEFLKDPSLSGDATGEEIEFLRRMRFDGRRPAPIFYYRELQNLRDPLHFRPAAVTVPE